MTVYASTTGQKDLPRYFSVAFAQLSKIKHGAVELALPDGRVFRTQGQNPGPNARVDIHNPDVFTRLAREGDMGFTDAYLEGWWTSPDLQAFLDLVFANNQEVNHGFPGGMIVQYFERLRHWLRGNSKSQARKNISYHYDLGNDFYSTWLDETMTYSSALFDKGAQQSLEAAQTAKYKSMVDQMGVGPGDHVLEIGCGWGGFAEYAARERGLKVTGLTISEEQYNYARTRIAEAGLADFVDFKLQDYRDEAGHYDGIASIEMFEAVGKEYWDKYFSKIKECLKEDGKAIVQTIIIGDEFYKKYLKTSDFIREYIFPGGFLPSPSIFQDLSRKHGLKIVDEFSFGDSYSKTLLKWLDIFSAKENEIEKLV